MLSITLTGDDEYSISERSNRDRFDGIHRFDLGRSLTGSGSLEFKLAWGGRVVPLTYGYHLHRARRLPVRTPDTPLYRALGAIWSHLPNRVVEAAGPGVVKHLF